MKKTGVIIIAVFICAVAAIAAVSLLSGRGKSMLVASDSAITANDMYVFYNNSKGGVCRVLLSGDGEKTLAKSGTVLSAGEDSVLLKTENGFRVVSNDGAEKETYADISADFGAITADHIYYPENGKLARVSRSSGQKEEMADIDGEVTAMAYTDGYVVFSCDNNRLFVFSEATLETKKFLDGYEIACVAADEDFIAMPNPNNAYSVVRAKLDLTGADEMTTVKTKTFTIKNGVVYYIDNSYLDEKEYELLKAPYKVG